MKIPEGGHSNIFVLVEIQSVTFEVFTEIKRCLQSDWKSMFLTSLSIIFYDNSSKFATLAYIWSLKHEQNFNNRSSHRGCSIKRRVLKNFAKFTRKQQRRSLFFNKVLSLTPAALLKKRLQYRCFPENFSKFLRTPFLQ